MLPFLSPKKISSVIVAKRTPEGKVEASHEEGEHDPALIAAAEDLLSAIAMKDAKAVASALQAAIEIARDDSEPEYEEDTQLDSEG